MATRKAPIKHPRLPNGFGRITKLKKANLRHPYRAMVTVGKNEEGYPIAKTIGYYDSWYAAYDALTDYHKNPYELKSQKTTIADLYKQWSRSYFEELTSESAVRTVTCAWEYVSDAFRKQNAAAVTPQMLKDYILHDATRTGEKGEKIPASDGIRSRIKSMFNLMYDYAVLAQIVTVNPARQFSLKGIQGKIEKQRKDKVPITAEHEAALWDDLDFKYTRMILINIYTGWRPEELIELRKENIDLKEMTMTGGMKTEAGTNRLIPIHPKIQDLVRYYYDRAAGEYLFYDLDRSKAEVMTYDKYRGRFKKIMVRHGWDYYSPSCPRHTFSTKAKESKMDDLARKLIMGHEITDVTDKHYTHLDLVSYLSEEIRKI